MSASVGKCVIGVRPDAGLALIYAVTEDSTLQPGQRVSLTLDSRRIDGVVIIAPFQMLEYNGDSPAPWVVNCGEAPITQSGIADGPALLASLDLAPDAIDPHPRNGARPIHIP